MNHAYLVLLAIGTAALHDTGRRMEIDVIAPSKLEAAVIAERNGNVMVADNEYVYAKSIRPVRTNHCTFMPGPKLAVAI